MAESVRECLEIINFANWEAFWVGPLMQIVGHPRKKAILETDAFGKIGVLCLLRQPPLRRPFSDHLFSISQVTRVASD